MLDLHGAPNSQNGCVEAQPMFCAASMRAAAHSFDNSGQVGEMRWHTDQQNIDRTKVVISKVVAEFAKPEYGGAVTLVELLNEPAGFKDRGIMPTYQKYLNVRQNLLTCGLDLRGTLCRMGTSSSAFQMARRHLLPLLSPSTTPSSCLASEDARTPLLTVSQGLKQWAKFWPRAKFPNTLCGSAAPSSACCW
jgi:hypothetical protein